MSKINKNKVVKQFAMMKGMSIFVNAKNCNEQGILSSVSTIQNFKPGVALVPLFEFFAVLDTPGDFVSPLFKNREK